MPSFFENSWVVSIIAGIISGIIVYFITGAMVRRKSKSKHLEQISSANRDIIQSLRPYVAEKGLPEKEIVNAIIVSTARRYNVKNEELYSIYTICEELIHEIIENVYVSSDQKREYSLQLTDYLRKLREEELDAEEENSRLTSNFEVELTLPNKMAVAMGGSIGIAVGIVVEVLTYISSYADPSVSEDLMNTMQFSLVIPVIPSAIILVCSVVIFRIIGFLQKKRKNRAEKSGTESPNDYGEQPAASPSKPDCGEHDGGKRREP